MRTDAVSSKVRPASVAGLFYTADPLRLRAEVQAFLTAPAAATVAPPKALIAPHDGYRYSGAVAGAAFATLSGVADSVSRVVLIGPAHYIAVHGIAVPTVEAFATPLGQIPVDRRALASLSDLPFVIKDDAPHAPEHALEVELPFLQAILKSFALVPLVVGNAAPQDVAEVLRRLWGDADTLVVVSSDLSHYLDSTAARRRDAATADAIERGEWRSLGPNNACGFLAVAGLLAETSSRGLNARRLALCNSGDTAGSPERVVGYGAWAFDEIPVSPR